MTLWDTMNKSEYDFLEIRALVAASFRKRKTEKSKKTFNIAAGYNLFDTSQIWSAKNVLFIHFSAIKGIGNLILYLK